MTPSSQIGLGDLCAAYRETIDAQLAERQAAQEEEDSGHRAALAPLVEAARANVRADLQIPRRGRVSGSRRYSPARVAFVAAALGAAAVVLLAVIGPAQLFRVRSEQPVEAAFEASRGDDDQHATVPRSAPEANPRRMPKGTPEVGPAVSLHELDPGNDEASAAVETDGTLTGGIEPGTDHRPVAERIEELDQLAQKRWREGDLKGAESAYRRIIRIGGRRRAVELAFADLFALARQKGDEPIGEWRRYLARFPSGRFAEDAKAGLCRRAPAAQRVRCWEAYRRQFPRGIHGPRE